ncbi:uncharacterized protein LOC119080450 isoform X2 [Bradysia coprophila]|uniref:uncharacterized protein LOC119080450 isoform X2 n=1 Tax=Bradysia coprophila TaxID=38358 RepID=UPI00187D7E4D|nr:uncharacterized protein LOC119080450 isoform X2 [Bradysia coprophila]
MAKLNYYFSAVILLIAFNGSTANWGTPGSGQYHIQTDEGPERFFRYQTDSGQFRKEKRLEDGTVIGTEAWIDALGYLRQKDYIADNQGYRILKSKTVFVGVNTPIQDAMKAAKKTPASAGTLVDSKKSSQLPKNTYLSPTTPSTYIPPTTARPNSIDYNPLGYDHYKSPTVFIQPNAAPLETYLPANHFPSTTERPIYVTPNVNYLPSSTVSSQSPYRINVPSSTIQTPFNDDEILHQPIAVYSPSTTPAPSHIDYGTPIAAYSPSVSPSTTPRPDFLSTIQSSSPRPSYGAPIEQINNELASPFSPHFIQSTTSRPYSSPSYSNGGFADGNNNVDVQPLFNRNTFRRPNLPSQPNQYYNQIGNSYDPSIYYDGVSQTRNGFKYFLPRQYHEEDNSDPERRDGSFGYIDPFGIRRVVYYKTSPEKGFVHRKNNRYVGFDATPYDPRPESF